MNRQKVRKLLLLISLLLFPITIYYFSPALIINAALEGIINGSFVVFIAMLVGGVFFGRLFCAYLCPAGALQEIAGYVIAKQPKQGWKNNIKYVIWGVWVGAVIFCYIYKGQIVEIDFFYQTQYGISISDIYGYVIYYGIVILILAPALLGGKRAFCHYFCWMAPFMVIGERVGKLLHIPGLHIATTQKKCVSCHKCNDECPMSVNPERAILSGIIDKTECIQCGACADVCPQKALAYKFGRK